MRTISLHKERLIEVFEKQKIATIKQLKKALNSTSSMTIFRKLKQLDYLSSCSHSGKYYTLKNIPKFDQMGLWFHKSILFSLHCSLAETIKNLVEKSNDGYSALELEKLLKVKPNEVLLKLINEKFVIRKKIEGNYIYFSTCKSERIKQEMSRERMEKDLALRTITPDVLMNEVKASIILFYCTLNEKQRRLYAGLESLKLGTRGDQVISELLGLNIKTVSKGKKELLDNSINIDTIRTSGGGRKKKKKLSRT